MKIVQHQRGFPHGLSENTQEYKGKGAAYDSKRCNEAFTSNRLVQTIFFHIVLDITILLYHKMEKNDNSH